MWAIWHTHAHTHTHTQIHTTTYSFIFLNKQKDMPKYKLLYTSTQNVRGIHTARFSVVIRNSQGNITQNNCNADHSTIKWWPFNLFMAIITTFSMTSIVTFMIHHCIELRRQKHTYFLANFITICLFFSFPLLGGPNFLVKLCT